MAASLRVEDDYLLKLVGQIRHGNTRAVDAFVGHCFPSISAFAAVRKSTDADGLADVVLFEFLRRLPDLKFDSDGQVWSYIYSITRSRLSDEWRKEQRSCPTDPGDGSMADVVYRGFEDELVSRTWINDNLSKLTGDQRQVIELRYLQDLSISETANQTGKSQVAVKTLQRRALNALLLAMTVAAALAFVVWSPGSGAMVQTDPAAGNRPLGHHQAHRLPDHTCLGRPATIVGSKGDDYINGTYGDDVIVALSGDDIVEGYEGDDIICLGDGDDDAYGGAGSDIIRGGDGDDMLDGEGGRDVLDGGTGYNVVYGIHNQP